MIHRCAGEVGLTPPCSSLPQSHAARRRRHLLAPGASDTPGTLQELWRRSCVPRCCGRLRWPPGAPPGMPSRSSPRCRSPRCTPRAGALPSYRRDPVSSPYPAALKRLSRRAYAAPVLTHRAERIEGGSTTYPTPARMCSVDHEKLTLLAIQSTTLPPSPNPTPPTAPTTGPLSASSPPASSP